MTEMQIKQLLMILESSYPRAEFRPNTVRVYTEMLRDLPFAIARQAVQNLVMTSRFLPTVSEIREECTNIAHPLPTPEEAWIEARQAAQHYSPYGSTKPFEYSSPIVEKAVRAFGVEAIAYSTNGEYLGRQFTETYRRIREAEFTRLQQTPALGLSEGELMALTEGEAAS